MKLLLLAGVEKSHTTPYHPMGNGQVERMNLIRALPPRSKVKWPQLLNSLIFAYNCTIHETTGFSPFFLMYGRIPRLPINFKTVLLDGDTVDMASYVTSLGRDLGEAMTLAQSNSESQQCRWTEMYNRRTKEQPVAVGDRVLLANKGERDKKKLADKWEGMIYTVVHMHNTTHTVKIRSPKGSVKTVLRNLIMSVNFLPFPDDDDEEHMLFSGGSASVAGSSFSWQGC